jgi:diguanylate cyclase (GGDEF)-like protein
VRCLEAGADDALVLPVHERIAAARARGLVGARQARRAQAELARSVEHGREAFGRTVDALRRSSEAAADTERRKRYLETHDALTGLANRSYFREFARRTLAYARRYGQTLAVLSINLDHFDRVNENLGHAVGDQLLQSVASRLRSSVRGSDIVARLGGDDFAVLLTSLVGADDAALVARKVQEVVARPHALAGGEIYVTPSIGIAVFPNDGDTPDALLRGADVALHRVKEQGRGQVQFYSTELKAASLEGMRLEALLREALERGQLSLHFQPQVDVEKRALVGCEALARWDHPQHGPISPGVFIPIAEGSGLIGTIGEWVLREACRQALAFERSGVGAFPIAVNVSRRQLKERDFEATVASILRETGLPPERLELEITENALLEDVEGTLATLRALRALGVGLAIDDFGTGYSSLSVLGQFPAKTLKIDQAFVRDISREPTRAAITRAVIAVASELELDVVAEGVETRDERDFLEGLGCRRMQGYLFGRPMPADELIRVWLDGGDLPD